MMMGRGMRRVLATVTCLLVVLTAAPARAADTDWVRVPVPSGVRPLAHLYDVTAATSTRAWSVGSEYAGYSNSDVPGVPLVLAMRGDRWSKKSLPGITWRGELRQVAAVSVDDVWATGSDQNKTGHVLHFDGTSWSEVPLPVTGTIQTLAAAPGHAPWIFGRTSAGPLFLLHWTGSAFVQVALPTGPATVSALGMAPDGTVWLAGYEAVVNPPWPLGVPVVRLFRRAGGEFQPVATGDTSPAVYPDNLIANVAGQVWIGGGQAKTTPGGPVGQPPASAILNWDGSAWQAATLPSITFGIPTLAADPAGNPAWATGTGQFVDGAAAAGYLKYVAGTWVRMPSAPDVAPESGPPDIHGVTALPGTSSSIAVGDVPLSVPEQSVPRIERENAP
jgi:hypothetical protein